MEAWARQLLVAGGVSAAAYASSPLVSAPWHVVLAFPGVLVLGGPLAILVLAPRLIGHERAWARGVAVALPGVALAVAVREGLRSAAYEPYPEVAASHAAQLVGDALWIAATACALAWLVRGLDGEERWRLAGCAAAAASAAVFFDIAPLLFALQAAALVGVVRFHRPAIVWARASVLGAGVLGAGLALLWLVAGQLWPPKLVLDETASIAVIPLALAAIVAFLATLVRGGRAKVA